ncbi:MAG: RsmF rRNA methyltransferase first C-terminal domain-containing protein [Bacteroidetes bacterium]|nr:RsmF rRNA methyltransferase first C-terminal domain-containing protein [Bacteroidota bacterium]
MAEKNTLPLALIESLHGLPGFDEAAFRVVHVSGDQITSMRINPAKPARIPDEATGIPWTDHGHYLHTRPSFTFDPLFHAGCYYVQEASSMFLEQAFRAAVDLTKPLKVLDLCAAPGGKSTHIQSLLSSDSLLVSNEVIRSRAAVLKDNIIKWGCSNVVVTNNDPEHFSRLENYFDVIVVDAPCSGSGLFRRDNSAIEEWSVNNVQLCAQRQQRILMDVWPALKENGVLIYSTCSYSKEEDEDILDWISGSLPSAVPVSIADAATISQWKIIETASASGHTGYRFWPDKIKGEGFFLACIRKEEGDEWVDRKSKQRPELITKKEWPLIASWVNMEGLTCIKQQQTVYAWPEKLAADMSWLRENLRMVYSGTLLGELMRDKLVPNHALAMSPLLASGVSASALNYEQSIAYLQRKELSLPGSSKGWQTVQYEGFPLGWVNVLPNRVNNYYPKELRILKEKE